MLEFVHQGKSAYVSACVSMCVCSFVLSPVDVFACSSLSACLKVRVCACECLRAYNRESLCARERSSLVA